MNTTIIAVQLKHSTQGWSKLIALGDSVDKTTNLDDSTMRTVGVDILEYGVHEDAVSTLDSIMKGNNSTINLDVTLKAVQRKGVAALEIQSIELP